MDDKREKVKTNESNLCESGMTGAGGDKARYWPSVPPH